MRKDIAPEQFNYNKYPGPEFISFDNMVKSDDILLTILENHKNAFDPTVFSQKFSDILLKYDYIVGDWGNEQLRLKGFYQAAKGGKEPSVEQLDIYLKEYCNFGCAYFILANPEPRELPKEDDVQGRRRRRRRSSGNKERGEREGQSFEKIGKSNRPHRRADKTSQYQDREKVTSQATRQGKKRKEPRLSEARGNEHQGSKTHFVIRKKEN